MNNQIICSNLCMSTLKQLANGISKWICKNGVENFHLFKLKPLLENYNGCDWSVCTKSSVNTYCRHKQKIPVEHCCQVFDIFVLTWRPGGATPVHNHPNTGCIYKVLKGELIEEIYDSKQNIKKPLKETHLIKGACGYIDNDIGFHRIRNPTDESAVSIHIYETGYKPDCFSCFEVPN